MSQALNGRMAPYDDHAPAIALDQPTDAGNPVEVDYLSRQKSRSIRRDANGMYREMHDVRAAGNTAIQSDRMSHSSPAPPSSFLEQGPQQTTPQTSPPQLRHKQRAHMTASTVSNTTELNGASGRQRNGSFHGSPASDLTRSLSAKKRKHGGFRTVMRRIFGRKSVKSQIGLPAPTKHSANPGAFITSEPDSSYQRAASLPAPEISRASALGSHAPFAPPPSTTEGIAESKPAQVAKRPPRPRRATLPSVIINSADMVPAHLDSARRGHESRDMVEENIGFAITSGSNPKRRSRSADALFDTAKAHRMSPIQWRRWRRRSDEIRYWRDSIGEYPTMHVDPEVVKATAPPDQAPMEEVVEPDPDVEDHGVKESRDTFDFGLLASAMQSQEKISVEERVVTLEVKLMDLEYAISKLQARTPSPTERFSRHLDSMQRSRDDATPSVRPPPSVRAQQRSLSADANSRPRPHERPSTGSDSNDLTTTGSRSTEQTSQYSQNEEAIDPEARPTSTATTLRAQAVRQGPASPTKGTKPMRNSLTSLTIEHYTTLIALIRREQSARIRLEEQISNLQRQVVDLISLSPVEPRGRVWKDASPCQRGMNGDKYRRGRIGRDVDETDTEDGFQDVYETPTERIEFEGGSFDGPLGGEAF